MKEATAELLEKNVGAVIITLGENGSEYFTKTEHIKQEAIKADAVDTTSAGDSYIGAMAVMLDQKIHQRSDGICHKSIFKNSNEKRIGRIHPNNR